MEKFRWAAKNFSAFTLAEVLITLTVIGIIAALTIPALITNMQEAQYKTAWRKAFSDINQATRKIANDNAGSLVGVFSNSNDVRDKLSTHLSYVKKCDENTPYGADSCWLAGTRQLSGNVFTYWDIDGYSRMVLNNGMTLAVDLDYANCTYFRAAKQNACADMAVDVNGFNKEPNTVGKDIFWGFITADGNFEPFGKPGDGWTDSDVRCDLSADPTTNGFTCAAQYLRQ